MRLQLEATPEELDEKGEELVRSLVQQVAPFSPQLAETLEKALPEKKVQLRQRALREVHERTRDEYKRTLERMMADIHKVITRAGRNPSHEILSKAEKGSEKPGHKWTKREGEPGDYKYTYENEPAQGELFAPAAKTAPVKRTLLNIVDNDPALTPAQKAHEPSQALREVMAKPASDPAQWKLPAGARLDPWEPKPIPADAQWEHPDFGKGTGAAPWQHGQDWRPDFHSYDYIVINTSAGKDSQAMLTHVIDLAKQQGYSLDKIVAVHADLGRVEWEGTKDLARKQAEHYGIRFEVVQRQQNDLIEQIEERHGDLTQRQADVAKLFEAGIKTWKDLAEATPEAILGHIGAGKGTSKWEGEHRAKELIRKASKKAEEKPSDAIDFGKAIAWPSSDARYCTSDHKRAEVKKLLTRLAEEHREKHGKGTKPRILNALGIRAQESTSREAMDNFEREEDTRTKTVDRWYPIHRWPEEKVWTTIARSGVPYHKAYALGMRRLSCVFCVFATKEDLMVAASHNPHLFRTYLDLEERVGASFQPKNSLADVADEIKRRREEGYELNELAEWVKKALGLDDDSDDLVKAELAKTDPDMVGMILEAALARLAKHDQDVEAVTIEWKVNGACIHLDTEADSHHVLWVTYPDAYNASLTAAAFAQKHRLGVEEHNAPPPLNEEDLTKADAAPAPAGPFIGPRGGKWADPQHTIPWEERTGGAQAAPQAEPAPQPVAFQPPPPVQVQPTPPPPVNLEAIRANYEAQNDYAQQRRYFTDRNTGLLNARGVDAQPHDPTRPMTARFSMEGFKAFNDKFGHEIPDGALRHMAAALSQHIPDGVKRGGDIEGDVRDQAHADQIAEAMSRAIDPQGRLRVVATAVPRGDDHAKTLEALGNAHKARKDAEVAAGRLGHRLKVPIAFADHPNPEEAMKPLADAMAAAPMGDHAQLSPHHVAEFKKVGAGQAFKTAHLEDSGLLTEDGFHHSMDLNPDHHVASADMRGLNTINEAFGRDAADLILKEFTTLIARNGGGNFNAAHPHGDEILAHHADPAQLQAFFTDLKTATDNVVFFLEKKSGNKLEYVIQKGLHFVHGVGRTLDEADRIDLAKNKKAQGDIPAPVTLSEDDAARTLDSLGAQGLRLINLGAGAPGQLRRGQGGAGGPTVPATGTSAGEPSPSQVATTTPTVEHSKAVQKLAGKTTADERGLHFETGHPVEFTFSRNLQKAPKVPKGGEDRFQQKIEPAGRYMQAVADDTQPLPTGIVGKIKFNKPIVLQENTQPGGRIYDDNSWKANLSAAYGGKKGKALSQAIAKDGYDGIVTVGKYGTGEIVDLRFLHTGIIEKAEDWEDDLSKAQGGPYIGPRGGKWADPEHTISWQSHEEREHQAAQEGRLFFHSTSKESAQDIEEHGLRPEAFQQRDSGFFGEGFYTSAHPQTLYGKSVVALTVKPGSKILNVGDLVPKEPQPFHKDMVEDLTARIRKFRPNIEQSKIDAEVAAITPGHPDFRHLEYAREVYSYAKHKGYDVASFANGSEAVILNHSAVEHARHVGGLKSAEKVGKTPPKPAKEEPKAEEPKSELEQEAQDFGVDLHSYFPSGSNHAGEIRGFAQLGWNVGVAVDALDKKGAAEEELRKLAGTKTKVFVDSGAFGEVTPNFPDKDGVLPIPDKPIGLVVTDPISHEEWLDRLKTYDRLAEALGNQVYVVAPDQVGNQAVTLERMIRYLPQVKAIHAKGANVMVPLQKGKQSLAEFDRTIETLLGTDDYIRAIPMKKDATSTEDLRALMTERHPARIHLLGLGEKSKRYPEVMAMLKEVSPQTKVTLDSVAITAAVGRDEETGKPRKLTAAQDRVTSKMEPEAFHETVGGLDYTDHIATPSGWAGPSLRRKGAQLMQLSPEDTKAFVKDPDSWVANNFGHPLLDHGLDAMWAEWAAKKGGVAEKKQRAVVEAFGPEGATPKRSYKAVTLEARNALQEAKASGDHERERRAWAYLHDTAFEHAHDVHQALQTHELSPEEYNAKHAAVYGPLDKFNPHDRTWMPNDPDLERPKPPKPAGEAFSLTGEPSVTPKKITRTPVKSKPSAEEAPLPGQRHLFDPNKVVGREPSQLPLFGGAEPVAPEPKKPDPNAPLPGQLPLLKSLDVPDYKQAKPYTCGVAALRSVLKHLGAWEGTEEDLERKLKTTEKDGTEPENIVTVANRLGLKARLKTGMKVQELKRYAALGVPVIVGYQAWRDRGKGGQPWSESRDSGHYAVVRGVENGNVTLKDPVLSGATSIPVDEFQKRWHTVDGERLGIVITRSE